MGNKPCWQLPPQQPPKGHEPATKRKRGWTKSWILVTLKSSGYSGGIILNDEHSSDFANVREKTYGRKTMEGLSSYALQHLFFLCFTPISRFKSMILCSFQMKDSFIPRRKLPKNPSPTSGIFLGPQKKTGQTKSLTYLLTISPYWKDHPMTDRYVVVHNQRNGGEPNYLSRSARHEAPVSKTLILM